MTKKQAENYGRLVTRLNELGFTWNEIEQLRRIEMALHRWSEYECGESNDRFSRAIERDETTDKPFWCVYWHEENKVRRTPCADRERGALKRLAAIMANHPELTAHHQTDPRGCALYIVRRSDVPEGRNVDSCYTNGIAIAA